MELVTLKTRLFISILFIVLVSVCANTLQTYIVQLNPQGVTSSSFASKPSWHLSFLEQTMSSEEDASSRLLYSYHSAMEGFAAQLSESELESLKMLPDVEVMAPKEVKVRVKPQRLIFTHINQSLSYKVWFISRKRTEKGKMSFAQGQLTWVNSNNSFNRVKSPFSVTWK
ncbi:hypothetical protein DVH24_010505 [Malus domestica]|uniref:Inhibitor I9 domain-containing protein n=1 Tax=Malus domestica TaxID=3750 RepID=A0A498JRW2_MALDO|nr:hypothetical protein DVH24_010505 [Malus domestica]